MTVDVTETKVKFIDGDYYFGWIKVVNETDYCLHNIFFFPMY